MSLNNNTGGKREKKAGSGLLTAGLGAVLFMFCLVHIYGCDPVARHEVYTTLFDGVPPLPSLDRLCREKADEVCTPRLDEYCPDYEKRLIAAREEAAKKEGRVVKRSSHPPYAQKKCRDCHDFTTGVGFVAPEKQLCFVCHKNFIRGTHVHGPVAVGDCLACHLPHDSQYTSLLQQERTAICAKCHQEKRVAESMHKQVIDHNMACVDCHDPHSSNARYFLR